MPEDKRDSPYQIRFTRVIGFFDSPADEDQIHQALRDYPNRKVINFYSKSYDDLMIVARHRAVKLPSCIFLNGDKVVARVAAVPSDDFKKHLKYIG